MISALTMGGCGKIDTNPELSFIEIQKDVTELTGHDVCWNNSLEECDFSDCLINILENGLNSELAVYIALFNNRNLQAIYENLGIAKAQLVQAGLLKNPIFSFSYRFSTKSAITDLIDMSLLQNFLDIILIPLKKKVAREELEATKAMITTQILDIIAQTKIAFYILQATEQIRHLKKEALLSAELSYEVALRLRKAGNIKDLELSQERSLYEQIKLEVASLEIEVLQAREKLNVLMGLWGNQINWKFSFNLPEVPLNEENLDDIENCAIASSIDLHLSYKDMLATAAKLGIDTSRLVFPQIAAGPSIQRDEGVWYVGPAFALAIPFFDFGQANAAAAQAEILRQWNHYTALAVEIRSSARSVRFNLLNALRQAQYLKQVIIPLAEQITSYTLLQYNAMQLGVFTLLITKQIEINKKIHAIETQRDYWIIKTELETLLNGHMMQKNSSKWVKMEKMF
ncbi:MAG: Cobalt-zinc-cadmium resistance protein CzcC [Chlamydiae bacterium]|nr:Cobalt-zinc-cadmium resistance protein CzcC [Chlamydiota bacterium]